MTSIAGDKISIIKDKVNWVRILDKVSSYDFYHTYDYHHLSKLENEIPILFIYEDEYSTIAIPFLLRQIFDTDFYDLTSVYGYSGPLSKNINKDFDNSKFIEVFQSFCFNQKIVSVFSRLHPYFKDQNKILSSLGETISLGKVVNIDLTKTAEEQRTIFSKTTKRYLNKTSKLCIVKKEITEEVLDVFIELYYENMDRVHAHKSYYFPREYFVKFIESEDFETEILYAEHKETKEIISAAIMIKTDNIIQYHISGTRNNYLNLTPIRLLIDTMRIIGTEEGYTYFNLGGGLGSHEDSLFNFKASFSKSFKTFQIWKYIPNEEVYNSLVEKYSNTEKNSSFFPLYRNSI